MEETKSSQGTYMRIDVEQFLYLLRQWTKKLKHGDSADVYFDLRIIKQVLKGENSFEDSTEELRALFNETHLHQRLRTEKILKTKDLNLPLYY